MSNYKFNLNPKDPDPDMVNRHKDFGKVLENYQRMTHPLYKTPLFRFRRIGIAVILVLTLTWMVIEFGGKKDEHQKEINDSLNKLKKDSAKTKSMFG
jgi:hypothetical protein